MKIFQLEIKHILSDVRVREGLIAITTVRFTYRQNNNQVELRYLKIEDLKEDATKYSYIEVDFIENWEESKRRTV